MTITFGCLITGSFCWPLWTSLKFSPMDKCKCNGVYLWSLKHFACKGSFEVLMNYCIWLSFISLMKYNTCNGTVTVNNCSWMAVNTCTHNIIELHSYELLIVFGKLSLLRHFYKLYEYRHTWVYCRWCFHYFSYRNMNLSHLCTFMCMCINNSWIFFRLLEFKKMAMVVYAL